MSKAILNKTLRNFLEGMNDARKDALLHFYDDYQDVIHFAAGSSHNHQAWEGGYADHIAEVLRISELYYDTMNAVRPLPYTKEAALMSLFFHDIEKPFRYGPKDSPECNKWRKRAEKAGGGYEVWEDLKWDILAEIERKYGLMLTKDEREGIEYAHGEGSAHEKFRRAASPLASHVHICDTVSARIWYNEGQNLSRKPKNTP